MRMPTAIDRAASDSRTSRASSADAIAIFVLEEDRNPGAHHTPWAPFTEFVFSLLSRRFHA